MPSSEAENEISTLARQRIMSEQSAAELAPLLTPKERALVSLLAVSWIHHVDLATMVRGYALENDSAVFHHFANQLLENSQSETQALHPLEIAQQIKGLFSTECSAALQSAAASGTLESFYRSWLAQTTDDRKHQIRHEQTHVAAFGRLMLRLLFCCFWIGMIVLYIVPEFRKMGEEFGVGQTSWMALLVGLTDFIAKILPAFLLCIILLLGYIVFFKRAILKTYLQRWIPGQWQRLHLPRSVVRRKLIAWDLQGLSSRKMANQGENRIDWDSWVSARELTKREAKIMKTASDIESRLWILRNIAGHRLLVRNRRFEILVRAIVIGFQTAIAVVIVLAAFAIFGMLLQIMEQQL